jgi:hypothetical protein
MKIEESIINIEFNVDLIYYILYGSYNTIKNLTDKLNEYSINNKINKKYFISKLNLPIAQVSDDKETILKKYYININLNYNNYLELIQCLVYADYTNKDAIKMYTIYCLEYNLDKTIYELKYPFIEISEQYYPEDIIYKQLKDISKLYASYIKNNLKLIDIIGNNNEIIVYSCKLIDNIYNKKN